MKLSIITVNYNDIEGLKKTINSVISQTFHDYEWIIIDGGSADGGKELIEQYQQHFTYWCSEPDSGIYNAMNKGIAHAKGEYINFMNSGDVYASPHTLSDVFSDNHQEDLLYGDWIYVYDSHEERISFSIDKLYTEFVRKNICHQALFIRTSLLKKKGYDETISVLADYARNVELAHSGASFKYFPFVICRCSMPGFSNIEENEDRRKQDKERIRQLYPQWVLPLVEELDVYRRHRHVQYTVSLVDGRCRLFSFLTKAYLKTMYSMLKLFNCLKNYFRKFG